MKMEVFYTKEVVKFLEKLDLQSHTRVSRTRRLFETQGFNIGQQYIKKITGDLWELKASNIRLFLCIRGNKAFGVHIIYKKTQKLLKQDIDLAKRRSQQI